MDAKEIIEIVFEESLRLKNEFVSDKANMAAVAKAASALVECYRRGGKVIVFGNGGSAADSQHLAAELMVRFEKERKSFPCIALTTNTSILTAAANDYDFSKIFSRQVEALADPSDVVVAISTSGNSENVIEGARAARVKKATVIALTGRDGGELLKESDILILAKSKNTARIQEIHGVVIHAICKVVEDTLTK